MATRIEHKIMTCWSDRKSSFQETLAALYQDHKQADHMVGSQRSPFLLKTKTIFSSYDFSFLFSLELYNSYRNKKKIETLKATFSFFYV